MESLSYKDYEHADNSNKLYTFLNSFLFKI